MRTYILHRTHGRDTLEDVLEREDITMTYRAKHIPMVAVQSQLEMNTLKELLPGYSVREAKEVRADGDD